MLVCPPGICSAWEAQQQAAITNPQHLCHRSLALTGGKVFDVPLRDPFTMQPMAAALGRLESIDLLSRAQSGAGRTYRYRAVFAGGVLLVSLEIDKDGKIAGASVENE